MHIVRQSALPVIGMSHEFVGKEQGPTGISFFLVSSKEPGQRVRLHKHDYDEVVHVIDGQSTWTIGDRQVIATTGDTVVVHAGEPHGFVNSGEGQLRQIDIHLHPTFETTWLETDLPCQHYCGGCCGCCGCGGPIGGGALTGGAFNCSWCEGSLASGFVTASRPGIASCCVTVPKRRRQC